MTAKAVVLVLVIGPAALAACAERGRAPVPAESAASPERATSAANPALATSAAIPAPASSLAPATLAAGPGAEGARPSARVATARPSHTPSATPNATTTEASDAALEATSQAAPDRPASVMGFERLMVRAAGDTSHLVDSQLQYCGGLGGYGLEARLWSPDGGVLFYTRAREGRPDGPSCGCCPGISAYSVSLGTTTSEWVVSPDQRRVARIVYPRDGAGTVEVSDLTVAAPTSYALPEAASPWDWPVWSPDGAWLAALDLPAGCGQAPSGALALHLGDGRWLRQPAPDPAAAILGLSWEDSSQSILLNTLSYMTWRWDLTTDTVTPATSS